MKIRQFLEHHGIARNPFAEEDAQTDPVFKDHCIDSTYHPTWDKIYGDPCEPATSIVFGEKGAGKTAIRLQIARHLQQHNRQNPEQRLLVIHYDDFNPFLDRFREKLSGRRRRRADRVLKEWKLWDHMDAILSLGVTGLVDRILEIKQPSAFVDCDLRPEAIAELDRHQSRDLLLLAGCYDQSIATTFKDRWQRLRKRLRFGTLLAKWTVALGVGVSAGLLSLVIVLWVKGLSDWLSGGWLYLGLILALAAWLPWLRRWMKCLWSAFRILRQMRLSNRDNRALRQVLMQFTPSELAAQPLPDTESTDDRYEMLIKFQGILQTLGFHGVIVLVDRLDEPHLINGSAELMKALLWPMLDNKFLKHPGLGLKIMAPIELTRFIEREGRDFYQRARLDKQNMVASFEWTGEALYDVANARLAACAADGATPKLRDLIDESLTDRRLIESLRNLRTPRHMFKFFYRLLVAHCNSHIDMDPVWRVSGQTFEATLAVYNRDQDAFDRGLGAG
ncbi:MAG: hypothetical protein NTY19_45780 [Planctomycetota bacterium]|nr:hypothetical protein [Planctomycetota bacterium]